MGGDVITYCIHDGGSMYAKIANCGYDSWKDTDRINIKILKSNLQKFSCSLRNSW